MASDATPKKRLSLFGKTESNNQAAPVAASTEASAPRDSTHRDSKRRDSTFTSLLRRTFTSSSRSPTRQPNGVQAAHSAASKPPPESAPDSSDPAPDSNSTQDSTQPPTAEKGATTKASENMSPLSSARRTVSNGHKLPQQPPSSPASELLHKSSSGHLDDLLSDDAQRFECTNEEYLHGLRNSHGQVTAGSIRNAIKRAGILPNDPRVKQIFDALRGREPRTPLSDSEVFDATKSNMRLVHQISTSELVISNFADFKGHLQHSFDAVKGDTSGNNADYIPILKNADSNKFGIAFCSVDGQFHSIGDADDKFSIQSTSKPMTFAKALDNLGPKKVHSWCGIEPSGRPFNDLTLLPDKRPFNPMVNAGALMTAATLASSYPDLAAADKPTGEKGTYGEQLWGEVLKPLWTSLTGDGIVGDVEFSQETFLDERATADNNVGIAYILKDRTGLPEPVQVQTMIDFYLRACSTTANASMMAVAAATLANGGRNPFSGKNVLSVDTVKKTLSVLSFCGFYDNAGEFFYETGVPSKSGVSGVVFLVLPNVGGLAIFSPRLDEYGNSVRGASFAKQLVDIFTFHSFDSLTSSSTGCKLDPRFSCDFGRHRMLSRMRWGVKVGDERSVTIDELLVEVCVRVAQADGSVGEDEILQLQGAYNAIMMQDLPRERVDDMIRHVGNVSSEEALDELYQLVSDQESSMIDMEKELILEAAFKVSTADGVVEAAEQALLEKLAEAMHVSKQVLDAKVSAWKDDYNEDDE